MITFLDRIALSSASASIMDLQINTVQWGWILGIFTIAYGAFEVPTGWLGDRLGGKKVLTRVVLWWSFFTILTGFSTGFIMLLVVRFLFWIGEAGAYLSTVVFGYLAASYGYYLPLLLIGIIVLTGAFIWFKIDATKKLAELPMSWH